MRAVLGLIFVVAATVACPCDQKDVMVDDKSLPVIIPASWKVKSFTSQIATKAFQGPWYVQMATPTYIKDLNPLRTGIFSNCYPATSLRMVFKDTTPGIEFDYNTDYYMIDSAFNLATQHIESTKTLFKSAYGSGSPYAIFNVGTPRYYEKTMVDVSPLSDDLLIRHTVDEYYVRDYTVACIGGDDIWDEYMVFAVVNKYDNIFSGNDQHILWVLTRNSAPDWSTYKKAFDDIKNSGMNPYYLMSIDQSTVFADIKTITPDDISGDSVIKSTTSTSSTTTTSDGTTVSSSSTTTTVSTVEFTLSPDYSIPYEFDTYDLFGDVKILKNLPADVIRDSLSGKYYLNSATPFNYNIDDARVGLLNTAFPAASIQVLFPTTDLNPWDYKSPCMMMDQGYNMLTGVISKTRNVIYSTYDATTPWGVLTVYSEGYYSTLPEEYKPLVIDGMICTKPSDLYTLQYNIGIVGYKKDKYVILTIANSFKNPFYPDNDRLKQLYVMTRDRLLSPDTINDINQEICRCGYHPKYLTYIDQTMDITDEFIFETSYFQITTTTVTSDATTVSTTTGRSLTPGSSPLVPGVGDLSPGSSPLVPGVGDLSPGSSPLVPGVGDLSPGSPGYPGPGPLNPCNGDHSPGSGPCPCCGDNSPGSSPLLPGVGAPGSGPLSPTGGIPSSGLPSIVPSNWKVKTFESSLATNAFQGIWYLQMATPTYMNDFKPIRPGFFSNVYPASNIRMIFSDTTPCTTYDYNTDYVMIDSTFNLATQRIETTETLFKSAYGPDSPFAIFNIATPNYYEETIVQSNPFNDNLLITHKLEGTYTREYTVACIGADDTWQEYMVFAIANQYPNLYGGNDGHIIWMFTREANPDWSTYKKTYDDLLNSGLTPNNLMSIDQSVDLKTIETVSDDDINGVITTKSVTTSSSTTTSDGTTISSSSSTTTTTSTVQFTLNSDYSIPYEFDTYDICGNYKILKNLPADAIRDALSGKYYINSATPISYDYDDNERVGLLNTAFPASSLQTLFPTDDMNPWDYQKPCRVLDRGFNMMTGVISQTRSVLYSPYDATVPWGSFMVYTEGYYTKPMEETSSLPLDGIICSKPADLYRDQYMACLAGYKKDKYAVVIIANQFKNPFYTKVPMNQLYVMTRDRVLTADDIAEINQELCRIGYNPNYLISIDQTRDISDAFEFTYEYYEIESVTVTSSSSSTVSITESSSTVVCS